VSALGLDRFLPDYDVRSAHETLIEANLGATYTALMKTKFSDSLIVRTLLRVRSLGRPLPPRPTMTNLFDDLEKGGFLKLWLEPEREVVFGIAGRFWLPVPERVKLHTVPEFQQFDTCGYAKAAWNISLYETSSGLTKLRTETRIRCFGSTARSRFRLYWALVGPFSGVTRSELLRLVKRNAQRDARAQTPVLPSN
jgi:hypothetical protein